MKTDWRILCIGNSFSDDTMEHTANILLSLGVNTVTLGTLYIGGCSIRMHTEHITNDAAVYDYRLNTGAGWTTTPGVSIRQAVTGEVWDVIAVQHGSADGSRYTDTASYEQLPALIARIKALAPAHTRIAFNMTWAGEPWHQHSEIVSYGGDQRRLYEDIARITREVVLPMAGLDLVSPTGTAVQNARALSNEEFTRDGYHLRFDTGRYLAGLTFIGAVTGLDIRSVLWAPDGVNDAMKPLVIKAAVNAQQTPFAVTEAAQ